MQAQRIGEAQLRVVQGGVSEAQQKRRVDINPTSGFDAGRGRHDLSALNPERAAEMKDASLSKKPRSFTHRFSDGTTVEVPLPSAYEAARIAEIMQKRSPEKQAALTRSLTKMGDMAFLEARNNRDGLTPGSTSQGLQEAGRDTVEQVLSENEDHSIVSQEYIYLSMHGAEQSLSDFFGKMKDNQDIATELRAERTDLKDMIDEWPEGQETQLFSWKEVTFDESGNPTVVEHNNEPLTKDQAKSLYTSLETQIDSLGTINQTDQMMFQKMVQDYQQTVTIISNTLKVQDEMLRSVIQNVRA